VGLSLALSFSGTLMPALNALQGRGIRASLRGAAASSSLRACELWRASWVAGCVVVRSVGGLQSCPAATPHVCFTSWSLAPQSPLTAPCCSRAQLSGAAAHPVLHRAHFDCHCAAGVGGGCQPVCVRWASIWLCCMHAPTRPSHILWHGLADSGWCCPGAAIGRAGKGRCGGSLSPVGSSPAWPAAIFPGFLA
jgi:hypothetical protein